MDTLKNFSNVRLQSYNHNKAINIRKHNLRYTQDSLSIKKDVPNYLISNDGKLLEINNSNKKKIYNILKKNYEVDRKKHNELYKASNKRNLRNFQSTWCEGIFTFSEAIHRDLETKYSKQNLSLIASNCAKEISKKFGNELVYMTLHLDETTPHFHFAIKNFDEQGLSLFNKNKNKEFLSKLQDIAYNHFKVLGMERGVSKEVSGKRYETIEQYHIKKEQELKGKVSNLEEHFNTKKLEVEKDLKTLYTEINLKKNEVKDLRNTFVRTSDEYKNLTNVFKQLQVEEKTLRIKVRELQEIDNLEEYLFLLKKDIKKIVNSNVQKIDPLLGNPRIEVKNITKMYSELVSKISEPLHSKVKEVEEKDKTIEKLKEDIVFKNKEIAQKDTKIKDLTQTTKQLESAFMVNYTQLEAMKKDFKTKVANQVRRLNLIHRLRNSNIANKIRLRLSKRLNSNQIDR